MRSIKTALGTPTPPLNDAGNKPDPDNDGRKCCTLLNRSTPCVIGDSIRGSGPGATQTATAVDLPLLSDHRFFLTGLGPAFLVNFAGFLAEGGIGSLGAGRMDSSNSVGSAATGATVV